ncbi:aldehyde dehydrogenase (NAD+) [Microbacterium testaceum]|uniref:aldehyde dehydrogenase family protein n=1 Tax=Microbacterium TaxID=33882 RepID=UPI002782EF25|nr:MULTISPECIES: aldehyde dehydrogenase family protein [Microbacterium]MDQ1111039.1 aldehyde dehydrogenase (NAD+) [Microbacterium testaceum]MDR6098421.1 aldehyde dehydrogenase (NAD+) [Microbacterium sp. SORGH_AS_0454]
MQKTHASPAARFAMPEQLSALADVIEARRAEVLAILTVICTRKAADYEVDAAVAALRGAGAEVAEHRPPRVSAIAVFLPSNVVLYSYVLYALVPSLYASRVLVRPASHVRDTVARLHALLAPEHGFAIEIRDETQRQFVERTVPTAPVVVFAGAYQNAERIRARLRRDQMMFFLGSGINPIVVTATADLERAARGIVDIRLLNSGQDCLGPDAIWVERDAADGLLAALDRRLDEVRYGAYDDPRSDYGDICYPGIVRDIADYLDRHQGRIHRGGRIHFGSRHIEPTVLVWDDARRMEILEFFSPIFNVGLYDDESVVVETLDSGKYHERAMGATVFGPTNRLVSALSRRHTLTVDETLLAVDDGNAPLGGRGAMANYIAVDGIVHPEPILLSKGLSAYLPRLQAEDVSA